MPGGELQPGWQGIFFFLISGGGNEDAKKGRFGPSADT